jgi:YidC/Oxa1 family membrane protein insertase
MAPLVDNDNSKNLILATALSMLVVLAWMWLFPPPTPPETAPAQTTAVTTPETAASPGAVTADAAAPDTSALATAPRIAIETPRLSGSISTYGGRIDDLKLTGYRETVQPGADTVRLLAAVGQENAYYALFGWGPGAGLSAGQVPDARTQWSAPGGTSLTPETPVTLTWDNGAGLAFTRTIAVDADYMFTVTDAVQNTGTAAVSLFPYGTIARHGVPDNLQGIFVVHEGSIGRVDGTLTEMDYTDIADLPVVEREAAHAEELRGTTDGWIGFTDHYWMTTLIPEQGQPFTAVTKFTPGANIYQTDVRSDVVEVAPGATVTSTKRLFAGAKEWATIGAYENDPGLFPWLFGARQDPARPIIAGFIDSIDWGWFYFLTKPIFAVLHWLNATIGNMGLAIIALTFILKILVLPLAYKSYVSMAKMKELQPEMEALKERVGDDRARMQKEMMQLYKDRKVNPAAGCLPILIQIPIFFALYKVIFVTIELRHAPFFGWLNDLSAPDASSIFNLFGLLPWAVPPTGSLLHLIFLGVLPILLGISMWLQQKLNPAPTDPVQATVFAWLPWVFMFMMGGFSSGLIVYWITNNLITFSQQYIIMRSHGHTPDLFGNIRKSMSRKPAIAAAPPPDKRPGKK